ncbi:hypothetical protein SAMN04487926_12314 [Paraburkholderia steynii]|uniref:Uncharacterized protein n=1 Tax=Paraburkholderia steynii TaxID=1245441 RepID=A0A7Z7BCJ3_9BURK|nr:hypothetical protein SAMN04487926_12314 [Paraburkholderia steynii]
MIFRDRPKGTAKHSPANDGFVAISKPQRDAAVATTRSFRRVAKDGMRPPCRASCARAACAFEYEALLARMLATPTPVSTLKRWHHRRR